MSFVVLLFSLLFLPLIFSYPHFSLYFKECQLAQADNYGFCSETLALANAKSWNSTSLVIALVETFHGELASFFTISEAVHCAPILDWVSSFKSFQASNFPFYLTLKTLVYIHNQNFLASPIKGDLLSLLTFPQLKLKNFMGLFPIALTIQHCLLHQRHFLHANAARFSSHDKTCHWLDYLPPKCLK